MLRSRGTAAAIRHVRTLIQGEGRVAATARRSSASSSRPAAGTATTCRSDSSAAPSAAAAAATRTPQHIATQASSSSSRAHAHELHRWLLAAAGGGAVLLWLATDADGLSGRVAAAEEADKATSSSAAATPDGSHHDYAHVNRALDPDFFDAEQYKLNEEGQVEWTSTSTRPRIVVLGTGWGSVSFLKGLDIDNYEIVVVSPRNYFLFTPLLPSACTGTLEMGSLTEPIRQILLQRHRTHQSQYVEAKAVGVDRDNRKVQCVDNNGRPFLIQYDHLIVGVGANNNTFDTPGVKDYAFFLKEAKHARLIRSKILSHFERAASPTTSLAEKELLLQFVVVGGGPTGVEFAGELIDFLDSDLAQQFPSLIPLVRVRLLQSQEHILNTYDAAISQYAENKFKELRIQVITNARVQAISKDSITFLDKVSGRTRVIPFGVCLWSTGIEMNGFTRSLAAMVAGQESNKSLVTDDKLRMLLSIPELDRVPKRIMAQAEQAVGGRPKPPQAAPTAAAVAATASSLPHAAAGGSSVDVAPAAIAVPQEDAPRDLHVDPRIYALGDCATTYVPKLSKRMARIFAAADRDQDGYLSWHELRELCGTLSDQFPVMSAQMSQILNQYDEFDMKHPNVGISMDEFRTLLEKADKNVRVYPATAQVASQQGKYLARRFNAYAREQNMANRNRGLDHLQLAHVNDPTAPPPVLPRQLHPAIELPDVADRPFRYKHLGSLAYIGGETAAIDLGQAGSYTGWAAFWLWKSAYLSEAVSTRTRCNLAFDWAKTFFFGRDTSEP